MKEKKKILKKILKPKIISIIVIILVVGIVGIGIGSKLTGNSKTNKLRFEDIGELATQVAYSTNVGVMDKSRDLFGISIPFTQSKYIYSYDYIIKAGLNFEDLNYKVNEISKTITVELPEIKVLSNEVDIDSLKVYHEDESIFTQIKLDDNNSQMKEMREEAEEHAIENGLLEAAEENAKVLIMSYFAQAYDLEVYTIKYK